MNLAGFIKSLKPYCWRLFCTAIGLVSAISIMIIGFWETILVLFCCGIGYAIGLAHDKNIKIVRLIKVLWSNRA